MEKYIKKLKTQIKYQPGGEGYLEAKETYEYTEKDIINAMYKGSQLSKKFGSGYMIDLKDISDYIQSLQQPKLPNTFECEMTQLLPNESFGLDYGSSNLKPKTTTNSQGQTELVGTYIF